MSAFTQYRDALTGKLKAKAMTGIENSLQSVSIETAYGPLILIKDPLKPAPPNPLMQKLKPKVTLNIKGQAPVVLEPYGDPGVSKWPMVKLIGMAAAGVVIASIGYGIYRAVR